MRKMRSVHEIKIQKKIRSDKIQNFEISFLFTTDWKQRNPFIPSENI